MPWANLDDGFYDHPKVVMAGNTAAGIFARMLAYCARHKTDGMVPHMTVQMIVGQDQGALERLIAAGMAIAWESGGIELPDYLDYNRSKAQVEADRANKSRAGARGAEARWSRG